MVRRDGADDGRRIHAGWPSHEPSTLPLVRSAAARAARVTAAFATAAEHTAFSDALTGYRLHRVSLATTAT